MSKNVFSGISYLDHCLPNLESLQQARKVLEKFEKICLATRQSANIADILQDDANRSSLFSHLGEEYEAGVQLLLKLAMPDYRLRSFTINNEFGQKKVDFMYRSVSAWKQFDTILMFQFPDQPAPQSVVLVNPHKSFQWKTVNEVPDGTLVTVFLKTIRPPRSASQEDLALDRYEALFDMLQSKAEPEAQPAPVLQLNPESETKTAGPAKPTALAAKKAATSVFARRVVAPPGPPSFSFRVVINKMDVFVHAGNAALIMSHIRDYPGVIQFYVLRDTKKRVQLDADSIWGAEIRNGESVMFEFYGPKPVEEFVKDLAKKVNKYTQMDKIANE